MLCSVKIWFTLNPKPYFRNFKCFMNGCTVPIRFAVVPENCLKVLHPMPIGYWDASIYINKKLCLSQ